MVGARPSPKRITTLGAHRPVYAKGDEPDGRGSRRCRTTIQRDGVIGWCIIDRPEARNALTGAMYYGIKKAVLRVDKDPELAALIITGTRDVFAPGGDLGGREPDPRDAAVPELGAGESLPFTAIRESRKPVIAAVNGICQGAAC